MDDIDTVGYLSNEIAHFVFHIDDGVVQLTHDADQCQQGYGLRSHWRRNDVCPRLGEEQRQQTDNPKCSVAQQAVEPAALCEVEYGPDGSEHHAVEPCDGEEPVGGRCPPDEVDAPFTQEPYRAQGDGPGQQPLGLSAGRFDHPWPKEVELLLDANAPVVHDGPDAGRDDERYVGTEEEIVPYIRVVPSMGDSQGDSHVGVVDGPYSQYPSHVEFGDADGLASLLFVEQQVGDEETADDEEHGYPVGHHWQFESHGSPVAKGVLEGMAPHDGKGGDGPQAVQSRQVDTFTHARR